MAPSLASVEGSNRSSASAPKPRRLSRTTSESKKRGSLRDKRSSSKDGDARKAQDEPAIDRRVTTRRFLTSNEIVRLRGERAVDPAGNTHVLNSDDPDPLDDDSDTDGFEEQVLDMWRQSEASEPTDPYRVLRAARDDDCEHIEQLCAGRLRQLGDDQRGAAPFLRERLLLAQDLLTTAAKRLELNMHRKTRRAEGTWADIYYPNGVYEGGVARTGDDVQIREGKGTTVLSSGEKYEGHYDNDVQDGLGVQLWGSTGDVYVGEWSYGQFHGLGIYYYGTGATYAGLFREGQRHGTGHMRWPNGSKYRGDFAGGYRTGHGKLKISNGKKVTAKYEGEFNQNRKHGEGSYISLGDGSYSGQFVDDRFQGEGEASLPRREYYRGSFKDGRPHGLGTYCWTSTGDRYEGEFRRGRMTGQGRFEYNPVGNSRVLTFAHQPEPPRGWRAIYDGQWLDGEPHGKGALHGDFEYEGEWLAGLKHGRGVYTWHGDCKFMGTFQNDLRHGKGSIEWADGSQWCGTLENDLRHGEGSYTESGAAILQRGRDAEEQERLARRKEKDALRDLLMDGIMRVGVASIPTIETLESEADAQAVVSELTRVANVEVSDLVLAGKLLMEMASGPFFSAVASNPGHDRRSFYLALEEASKGSIEDIGTAEQPAQQPAAVTYAERWYHGTLLARDGKPVRSVAVDGEDAPDDLTTLERELQKAPEE